jgi:membrane protein DedA with SNARE-associated domain
MWFARHSPFVSNFFHANMILAPLLLLTLEEVGVPTIIPGDAILAYVGASVKSAGPNASLITATLIALTAVLLGSTILFFVARRYGTFIVHRLGKFLFIKERHIEKAQKMFTKYGVLTIIFGRHIPGMRAPITIFAAVSGIRYSIFITSVFVSALAWAIIWLLIGHRYGANFQEIVQKHALLSIVLLSLLIVGVIGFHFYGEYREKRRSNSKK